MITNERFKLMRVCYPPLENGKYTVSVTQNITQPNEDSFESDFELYVGGTRFSLLLEEVYSVYPPENAIGGYSNTMAHITLKNKTLPWVNDVVISNQHNQAVRSPWLALISVSSSEHSTVSSVTIDELHKTTAQNSDIFYPFSAPYTLLSEKSDDLCTVIDLPLSLYQSIMPREDELSYLTHVKIVDMYDKTDNVISEDGCFSVAVSNRFIPSTVEGTIESKMHLVSVEGFGGYLPDGSKYAGLSKYKTIRMVSLYSWGVYSKTSGDADYRVIMENISTGALAISGTQSPVLSRGHIPLNHSLRTGEKTVSLYRGPLSPYYVEHRTLEESFTADGQIIYDPEVGIFDMSYSAAWQLGRLMVLRSRSVAAEIIKWRKSEKLLNHLSTSRHLMQSKMNFSNSTDFWDFLGRSLCPQIIEGELIAPVARDDCSERALAHIERSDDRE